ncbi:hypothetical protein OG21DRAFT_1486439 [Imleria badia]|nr:hypothetical protein OG21DRAFT_1486439 [Imleria badia]
MPATDSQGTFLDTALELLSYAIDAEDNHDYTEAYAQYMAALDYLMAAQQAETNEKSRALLKSKADEYLNRAEEIRQRTYKQPDTSAAADVNGFQKGHITAQSVILEEAFKCAKQAIDADASKNYAEAYKQYMKSMDYFMFAQRCFTDELNEQSRSLIRSEVAEYLTRAEAIKKHLDSLEESESRAVINVNLSKGPPRPPEVVFLHTAIEITQRAIQQDTKKNYRSAYELYNGALDYFMLSQKYEKNEQSRTAIRASMEEYLSRAEALKKHPW